MVRYHSEDDYSNEEEEEEDDDWPYYRRHRYRHEHEDDEESLDEEPEIDQSGYKPGRSPEDFLAQVWSTLCDLQTPTFFATMQHFDSFPNPGLCIPEHGIIGIPLSKTDAGVIMSRAKQITNDESQAGASNSSSSLCWEIDAPNFCLQNTSWAEQMQGRVSEVYNGLDLACGIQNISLTLSKLVLYEPGAYPQVQKGRMSEGANPSFGTLMVCLPSAHTGGKFVFKSNGEERILETEHTSKFGISGGAWYSNVDCEINPITSGYRLVLLYDLICDPLYREGLRPSGKKKIQRLTELLKTYQSGDNYANSLLANFMIHKLNERYMEGSLRLDSLGDRDKGQMAALIDVCNALNCKVYLATLELSTVKYENGGQETRHQLKKVVELDGSAVTDCMPAPWGYVTDPREEDRSGQNGHDESHQNEHEVLGPSVTYYYRNAVALIVPPNRLLDFFCAFSASFSATVAYMNEARADTESVSSRQARVIKMCYSILGDLTRPPSRHWYDPNFEAKARLRSQVARIALEYGDVGLFYRVCTVLSGPVAVEHADALGAALDSYGLEYLLPCLGIGLHAAAGLSEKRHFLLQVDYGFRLRHPQNDNDSKKYRNWWENTLFDVTFQPGKLQASDIPTLVEISKSMGWMTYEARVNTLLKSSTTSVGIVFLIAFLNYYLDLDEPKIQFAIAIIEQSWQNFSFLIDGTELMAFMTYSLYLIPSYSLDEHIIPRLLEAAPSIPSQVDDQAFIVFVRLVLQNHSTPFVLPDDSPIPSHPWKILVQFMLAQYLSRKVGPPPIKPDTWAFSGPGCGCEDCNHVDSFMKDPNRIILDFRCAQPRRKHLDSEFLHVPDNSYNIETVKDQVPYLWRVTKNRSRFERDCKWWSECQQAAIQAINSLGEDAASRKRLKAYLDPHWTAFTKVDIKRLPDIILKTPLKAVSRKGAEQAASTAGGVVKKTNRKRGRSKKASTTMITRKRAKANNDKENANVSSDTGVEVEVIDLSDI